MRYSNDIFQISFKYYGPSSNNFSYSLKATFLRNAIQVLVFEFQYLTLCEHLVGLGNSMYLKRTSINKTKKSRTEKRTAFWSYHSANFASVRLCNGFCFKYATRICRSIVFTCDVIALPRSEVFFIHQKKMLWFME